MAKKTAKKVKKSVERRKISINKGMGTLDEAYTDWYVCPNCGDSNIMKGSKYCSACGLKINWKD